MTTEEIRQKAIECRRLRIDHCNSRKMKSKYWEEVCINCEYYEPHAECTTIYAYEHGFADGIEEGKRQATAWIPVTERLPKMKRQYWLLLNTDR